MFDEVEVLGDSPLRCAAGHAIRKFQTKDMGEESERYILKFDRKPALDETGYGQLFLVRGSGFWQVQEDARSFVQTGPESFALRVDMPLELVTGDHLLTIYSDCRECEPVYFRRAGPFGGYGSNGLLEEQTPWVEWEVTIRGGMVTSWKGTRLETREQVREWLARAVPDADPLVVAHKAMKAERGAR